MTDGKPTFPYEAICCESTSFKTEVQLIQYILSDLEYIFVGEDRRVSDQLTAIDGAVRDLMNMINDSAAVKTHLNPNARKLTRFTTELWFIGMRLKQIRYQEEYARPEADMMMHRLILLAAKIHEHYGDKWDERKANSLATYRAFNSALTDPQLMEDLVLESVGALKNGTD